MDIQLFLVIVLAILTLSIVVVCVYVVVVLKQFSEIGKKVNATATHAQNFVNSLSNPLVPLVGTLEAIAEGIKTVKNLKNDLSAKNIKTTLENVHETAQENVQPIVEDIKHAKEQITSIFEAVSENNVKNDKTPKKKNKRFFRGTF